MEQLHDSDPETIGPYRVVGRLGSGGMGRVYLCTSPGGRRLAVKVIRPELADDAGFRARFRREVASARLVRSHVTAAVVDADTESPTPWLATLFLDGPTLSAAVEQSPLAEPELRRLAAALAEALQSIHGAGLVHRDLKPSNIILAPDGPRVIDFGIARAVDATALTTTNLRVGSPGYMAPEQIRTDRIEPESDIFALGAVLAYAATGQSPFGSGATDIVLYRVLHEEPNLDGVPPSLHALVAACLAKDPGQRPTPGLILQGTTGDPATLVLTQPDPGEPAYPDTPNAPTLPVGVAATSVGTHLIPQPEAVPARRSRRGVAALTVAAIVVLGAGTAWAAQPWRSPSSASSPGSAAPSLTAPNTTTVPSTAVPPSSNSSRNPKRVASPPPTTSKISPRPQPNSIHTTPTPGIFVGKWNGHAGTLVFKKDGSATAVYRVYVWCSDNPTPPCDQMKGNLIISGGRVTLHLAEVITANGMSKATAIVDTSSEPNIPRGSHQKFELNGDVITWTDFGSTFCGSKAAAGACGA